MKEKRRVNGSDFYCKTLVGKGLNLKLEGQIVSVCRIESDFFF